MLASYLRRKEYGKALKKFQAIDKVPITTLLGMSVITVASFVD
jgi:hypothetical protein